MAEAFFRDLRQKLSSTVDGAWVGKIDEKKSLSKIARDTGFAACLKKHMEAGTGGRATFRECQEAAALGDNFRKLWGTA